MTRHFIAVQDGRVVGSRSTEDRTYRWAVLYQGPVGWFASFHQFESQAVRAARTLFTRAGLVVSTIETPQRVPVGATWRQEVLQ